MPPARAGVGDVQVEQIIGNLLRAGVLAATVTVLAGGVVTLLRHGREAADFQTFRGEPDNLRSPLGIVRDALSLHGRSLIELGLLLLIATPVLRVIFSIWAFCRQRDWLYVGFTLIVLCVLLYSIFHGGAE